MARQPASKRPTAKPATAPAAAPRPRIKIGMADISRVTGDLSAMLLNVAGLLLIIVLVPIIVQQFLRDEVRIDPIAVPEALQATGLTPDIAANRLWDGLEAVKRQAGSAKRSIAAIPESRQIDFSIPDSGVSIDSLIHYVRRFFNAYETRVSGEFRCADSACAPEGVTLRLRISRSGLDMVELPPAGSSTEDQYFRKAAAEVLAVLDPFTALAAQATGDPARALVLARQLVRGGHPDSKWALNLIGNIELDRGEIDAALADYRAALAIDAGFIQARTNVANALRLKGDLDGARAAYDEVQRLAPEDVFMLAGYAELEVLSGRPDEAVALLERASRRAPLNPLFPGKAGIIEYGLGRTDEAELLFRRALEIDPTTPLALLMLVQHYIATDRPEDAERLYREAADYAPDDAEMQAQHAEMLRRTGRPKEAMARIDKALRLAPAVAAHHATRGLVLRELSRLDEALAEFETAATLAPDNASHIYDIGFTQQMLDRPQEALASYRRYLKMAPDSLMAPAVEIYAAGLEAGLVPAMVPSAE